MIRWRGQDEQPGIMAEFATEEAVQYAVLRLRESGYVGIEIYSPYPVAGATALLGLRRPLLTWIVFWFAMAGAGLAFLVQWFVNAKNYPINGGGRPLFSLPAGVPIIFEMGVLAAGFTAFSGLLVAAGLPRLWYPTFEVPGFESASVDRFWLSIDRRDPRFDPAGSRYDLEELDPLQIRVVEVEA
jgi:hypothetical protein